MEQFTLLMFNMKVIQVLINKLRESLIAKPNIFMLDVSPFYNILVENDYHFAKKTYVVRFLSFSNKFTSSFKGVTMNKKRFYGQQYKYAG